MSENSRFSLPWIAHRYELKEQIGSGGQSQVYSAWDHQLGRAVALKQISNRDHARKSLVIEETMREAMIIGSVRHPHIISILNFGVEDESVFIVMELIEGTSLEQWIEKAPLTIEEFHLFTRQALEGIAATHERRLIHRDLKPSNFMLQKAIGQPFVVKLLDFGLAKQFQQPEPQTVDHLNSLMGTIYYMAPEQLQRAPVDQRTDLYSFGCILYEALTGETAFKGETIASLIWAHVNSAPKSLSEARPDISPRLEKWIMKFLEKKPENRFQSAAIALRAFPKLSACFKKSPGVIQELLAKFPGTKKRA